MSMKNSNDIIGNRIRDLPICSVVPQRTAPARVPNLDSSYIIYVFSKRNKSMRVLKDILSYSVIMECAKIFSFQNTCIRKPAR